MHTSHSVDVLGHHLTNRHYRDAGERVRSFRARGRLFRARVRSFRARGRSFRARGHKSRKNTFTENKPKFDFRKTNLAITKINISQSPVKLCMCLGIFLEKGIFFDLLLKLVHVITLIMYLTVPAVCTITYTVCTK